MHIVILGAGAVGGYFGGKLAQAGVQVTFFVREQRAQMLKANGLSVYSKHGDFTLKPQVATAVSQVDDPDIVLLALKNYHLALAMPLLNSFVQRGAVLLPLLNGVQHIDELVRQFGSQQVLGGTCFIESTLNQSGDVIQTSQSHDVVYGPLTEMDASFMNSLDETLQLGQFVVRQSDHIRIDVWQKFLFLTSFSGITAATHQPIGLALHNSETRAFLQGLIHEGCLVARAEGIELPDRFEEVLLKRMDRIEPEMTSSLHRDMMKQVPMELDSLQGAMLEMALRHQIAVPYFQSVFQLLSPYKNGGLASLALT